MAVVKEKVLDVVVTHVQEFSASLVMMVQTSRDDDARE